MNSIIMTNLEEIFNCADNYVNIYFSYQSTDNNIGCISIDDNKIIKIKNYLKNDKYTVKKIKRYVYKNLYLDIYNNVDECYKKIHINNFIHEGFLYEVYDKKNIERICFPNLDVYHIETQITCIIYNLKNISLNISSESNKSYVYITFKINNHNKKEIIEFITNIKKIINQ